MAQNDDDTAKAVAEAVKAIGNWLNDFKYQDIGGECPDCHHSPRFKRHVGFMIGGHHQTSCPCRLIRESGRAHPCGCEWTEDTD